MNASSNKTAEAVYVHVPFCSRKCPYCAFSCKDGYAFDEVALYLRTLGAEAAFRTGSSRPSVRTLYFGGGTPSALGVRGLRSLYATLRSAFDLRGMIEHTVELNPEHVDRPLSEAVASEGCRRASLGVQSFSPFHLKRLGRDHEAGDVVVSFEALRKADVRSVNVDLMYGLPLQSVSDFLDDLKKALDLGADHVSLYQLEFDDSTPFGFARSRGRMAPADDGAAAEMFHGARETASRYGLEWYETSNFAREGHQSVHNRVYWANAPYLGLGPGAYGRIGALRYRNHAETTAWSRALDEGKAPHAEEDFLDSRDDLVESLVVGLRTRDGVPKSLLHSESATEALRDVVRGFEREGFAVVDDERLRPTVRGMLVLDSLLPKILDALPKGGS